MNADDIIKAVGVAIALAFGINDELQLLQILLNMSNEGIQKIADIITTEKDEDKKIKLIQTTVQKDIQATKAAKALFGAKLKYLQFLKQGHTIKSMRQDGDPGSTDSTQGMRLKKKFTEGGDISLSLPNYLSTLKTVSGLALNLSNSIVNSIAQDKKQLRLLLYTRDNNVNKEQINSMLTALPNPMQYNPRFIFNS